MIELHRLSNGIQVAIEPMKGVRSASIGIYVKAGSAYETRKNNGIFHAIEHMMFKGTTTKTAKEIAKASSRIGGDLNAYTAKEETCYYATVLDEHLEEAIDLLSDIFINSKFEEEDLKRELEVILEEIDMYQDSPEDLVIEYLQKISMPKSSLGYFISGEKEVVSNFQRQDLIEAMQNNYAAENIVISIAGSVKVRPILKQLEEEFGGILTGNKKIGDVEPYNSSNITFVRIQKMLHKDIEQIHLALLFPSVSYRSQERFAQSILDHCLGDSDDSRLFQRLREELGLAYSIYTFSSSYEKSGVFQIYGATNPQKAERMLLEIKFVLEEIVKSGITKEELSCAKERIRAEILMEQDSCQNRMSQNGKSLLLVGTVETAEEIVKKIMAVTREEVHQFAKTYLQPQLASMAAVGGQSTAVDQKLQAIWKSF